MKISAALAAVAAVALAPLAAAQVDSAALPGVAPVCAAGAAGTAVSDQLKSLQVSHSVKRTTVNSGARLVQTIVVKNPTTTTISNLVVASAPFAELQFLKARAGGVGNGVKPAFTVTANNPTTGAFSLPAGKQLKATVAYKAKCPGTATFPKNLETIVRISTDATTTCFISPTPAQISIIKKRNCP